MKPSVRYLVHVLALVAFLQALLIAGALHNTVSRAVVDTYDAYYSIYSKSLRMVVYGSPLIAKQADKPQLIILGASDTLLALRPQQLSALTHIRVHNLATEQQNISSFTKLLDLIYMQTPRENWKNLNIMVAVSAPALKSDALRWKNGPSDVEIEMMRYGVFNQTRSGIIPRVGEKNVGIMLQAALPFMMPFLVYSEAMRTAFDNPWLYRYFKNNFPKSRSFILIKPWFPSEAESNALPAFTAAQRADQLHNFNNYMGPWNDKPMQQLEQIAERVSATGGHFFFVELPTAGWLHKGLRFHQDYQKYKLPYIARMEKMPRVHYINLQHGFSDDAFYDGAHTRAAVRPEIARRVAGPINRALAVQQLDKEHTDGH